MEINKSFCLGILWALCKTDPLEMFKSGIEAEQDHPEAPLQAKMAAVIVQATSLLAAIHHGDDVKKVDGKAIHFDTEVLKLLRAGGGLPPGIREVWPEHLMAPEQ